MLKAHRIDFNNHIPTKVTIATEAIVSTKAGILNDPIVMIAILVPKNSLRISSDTTLFLISLILFLTFLSNDFSSDKFKLER
jgi:hypothetical protein